jgi:hypothetical protein
MTVKAYLTEDEDWPTYFITPEWKLIGNRRPNVEVPNELLDEYERARDQWCEVQAKLRKAYQERYGDD